MVNPLENQKTLSWEILLSHAKGKGEEDIACSDWGLMEIVFEMIELWQVYNRNIRGHLSHILFLKKVITFYVITFAY